MNRRAGHDARRWFTYKPGDASKPRIFGTPRGGAFRGHSEGMSNEKEQLSPGEASREGLRELDAGHPHHASTEHTAAVHPNGPKFDETASEVHRGGVVSPNEKK